MSFQYIGTDAHMNSESVAAYTTPACTGSSLIVSLCLERRQTLLQSHLTVYLQLRTTGKGERQFSPMEYQCVYWLHYTPGHMNSLILLWTFLFCFGLFFVLLVFFCLFWLVVLWVSFFIHFWSLILQSRCQIPEVSSKFVSHSPHGFLQKQRWINYEYISEYFYCFKLKCNYITFLFDFFPPVSVNYFSGLPSKSSISKLITIFEYHFYMCVCVYVSPLLW